MVEIGPDVISISSQIVNILFTVGATGALLFQAVRWINKRQDDKAVLLKHQLDEKSAQDKAERDHIASLIKAEAQARDVENARHITESANEIMQKANKDTTELTLKLNLQEERINSRIEKIDNKVMDMLTSLSKRSDLVNGNIANIRTDIADLQDDIAELSINQDSPLNAKVRTRTQKLKRRRIEADRVAQSERSLA